MSESPSEQPSVNPLSGSSAASGRLSPSSPGQVAFQLSQEPVTLEGPAAAPAPGAAPAPAYEHLGELPATYGTQSLYLVAYDPRQLFAYWDVDWSVAPGSAYSLQVHRADGSMESQVDIVPADAGRYLGIGQPGGSYYVELGARGRDGQWRTLTKSGYVTMPPDGIAGEMEPKFATLPFHLSFQRLVELLQGAVGAGENLTDLLARLQNGGQPMASSLLGALGGLSREQLRTLEMLLGQNFSLEYVGTSRGGDSSEVSGGVLAAGAEGLSSSGVSSYGRLAAAAAGSETLSSGAIGSESRLAAGAMGSETLSSSSLSSASRFSVKAMGSETLSSGAMSSASRFSAESIGSETLSSGSLSSASRFAAESMGSESLSSGSLSSRSRWVVESLGSESLSSRGYGLSSEMYAAAAGGGSELLSSTVLAGLAVSSEAWRAASGGGMGGSDFFASEQSSLFQRAVETNLETLGALFSSVNSELSGALGGSSSTGGSGELSSASFGGGSSEGFSGSSRS